MVPEEKVIGSAFAEVTDFIAKLELKILTPENVEEFCTAIESPPFKSRLVKGLPFYELVWLNQLERYNGFLNMSYRYDSNRRPGSSSLTIPYSSSKLSATNFSFIAPSDGLYNGLYVNTKAGRRLMILTIPFCKENLPKLYKMLNMDAK